MPKAEATVEELVGMIERGELRLPEMQRGYVWRAPRVRDLMDSLYRGYPSGAILLWETDELVPLRDTAVGQHGNPYASTKLLLDGQQRLTSLSSVIRGEPIDVRGRKKPIELLFNLEHPDGLNFVTEVDEEDEQDEEDELADATEQERDQRLAEMTFVVSTKKVARLPHWVSVTEVFKTEDNATFIERAGVESFKDPRFERYSKRLNRLRGIRKYTYRMDILERSLSYEEVTEIFVRVNSLGAKLRSSDLAMAQITATWRDSLKIFEEYQSRCARNGFDLGLGVHVRNLIAFATDQSRFRTVGRLTQAQLVDSWTQCKQGIDYAINFLKCNAGIDSPALLSSPSLLIALGYFGHHHAYKLSPKDEGMLRYWLLVANTKGRYSRGSSETLLDEDLQTIHQGRGARALIDTLRKQFGRLDVEDEDLEGRNARSAYFKAMFMAFRADGAKDWASRLAISLSHAGRQHRLQFHHIFPRAVLQRLYPSRQVNDIANLAFIGGKTNRRISNKPPSAYLPTILKEQGQQALEVQCIPATADLWRVDCYPDFLRERRRLIAQRLDQFLTEGVTGAEAVGAMM